MCAALKDLGAADIKPLHPGEATGFTGLPHLSGRHGIRALGRFIILAALVLVLGGAIFLLTWDIPPPTAAVEVVIPDAQLPR